MKERPILFSAPMVRAILEGRKTMTRRAVRIPNWQDNETERTKLLIDGIKKGFPKCPYGKPGDRLWVRETFTESSSGVIYRADPMFDHCKKGDISWKWKPSIFMPRKFSRITLEITNVRVERLQDITEDDADDEGVEICGYDQLFGCPYYKNYQGGKPFYCGGKDSFKSLWESINGPASWSTNPFVWVVEFKRVEK